MSAATEVRPDVTVESSSMEPPSIAHAWCTCYERDGLMPFPSLCGQSTKERTPEALDWPSDKQACVLCAEMVEARVPCPRCGAA